MPYSFLRLTIVSLVCLLYYLTFKSSLMTSPLFCRNIIIQMAFFSITEKNILWIDVLYEGLFFSYMWIALTWRHHFNKKCCYDHKTSLTPPLVFEVSVPRQENERSCVHVFVLRYSNWSLDLFQRCGILYFLFYCSTFLWVAFCWCVIYDS
jgi:hypothetical protein